MASIVQLGNRKRIDFIGPDGVRQYLTLGVISMRDAEKVKIKIEEIVNARITGTPISQEDSNWLAGRPAPFYAKLVKKGLAEARIAPVKKETPRLQAFILGYAAGRNDVKVGTQGNYYKARIKLVEYFGPDRELESINGAMAADWKRWLQTTKKLKKNSAAAYIKTASLFFEDARKRKIIAENPFEGLTEQIRGASKDRIYFIPKEHAERVLSKCDDIWYAAIFALARFGGLRTPSETNALQWSDIDWDRNRFTVHSSKTEHHEGKAERIVPLFPELRPYLEAIYDAAVEETGKAPEGYVLKKRRTLRSPTRDIKKIIAKAGLKPWPRSFQNLRSTRETELVQQGHPLHVVCAWIGNSATVAQKHYLQVTESDFEKAQQKAQQQTATHGRKSSQVIATDFDFPEEYDIARESSHSGSCFEEHHQ